MYNPAHVLAILGVVIATLCDWKTRRVPNWLTIGMLSSGICLGALQYGLTGCMNALVGAAVGLAIFLLPFAMGWLGGGDVKLFMGIGALLGSQAMIWVALYSAVAGGVLALSLVIVRLLQSGQLQNQVHLSLTTMQLSLAQKSWQLLPATQAALREKFPYALAIGIGTCFVIWQGYPSLW